MCGSRMWLESHHVFGGTANRKQSEKYGLKVWLCHYCHNEPPDGVHHSVQARQRLQHDVQLKAMSHYGWDTEMFRSIFGKNYLIEE